MDILCIKYGKILTSYEKLSSLSTNASVLELGKQMSNFSDELDLMG